MNSSEIAIKKIKLLREINNYTQNYVAGQLELSQNAYSLIEKGFTKLTLDRIDQIAAFYKIDTRELLTESDSINIGKSAMQAHSNFPPVISPLEKILYEKTIANLESNISKLYRLIEQLTGNTTTKATQSQE